MQLKRSLIAISVLALLFLAACSGPRSVLEKDPRVQAFRGLFPEARYSSMAFGTGQVGSIQSATTRQNVVGNDLGTIVSSGSDHYIGANNVAGADKPFDSPWTGGTVTWGVFPANAAFPASLYLTNRPAFFGNDAPWPMFGPGLSDWGVSNQIPARIANPVSR